jgi:hypothetical protein
MSGKSANLVKNRGQIIPYQISRWDTQRIKEKYSYIKGVNFKDLERGLAILYISEQEFKNPWITAEEISSLLVEIFKLSSTPVGITRSFARAGGAKRINKPTHSKKVGELVLYKLMKPGEDILDNLRNEGLLRVLYLGPNTHRIAREKLYDLIRGLKGRELLISDPYYGIDTLGVLEEAARARKKIKFLTFTTNDSTLKFGRELSHLRRLYPHKIEIRVYPKKELHDRYILADDSFIMVGHGIKDIGNKESLMLIVDDRFGKDVRKELEGAFRCRWGDKGCKIL